MLKSGGVASRKGYITYRSFVTQLPPGIIGAILEAIRLIFGSVVAHNCWKFIRVSPHHIHPGIFPLANSKNS